MEMQEQGSSPSSNQAPAQTQDSGSPSTPAPQSPAQETTKTATDSSKPSGIREFISKKEQSLVQPTETKVEEGVAPPTTPEKPAYQPNYKYKMLEKEHEMDEFIRAAIKDPETEKKVRELYEKAYGLDVVKPKFQETREKLKTTEGQLQEFQKSLVELKNDYTNNDFDSFFQKMGIPEQKILEWVWKKVEYSQLPPEQKQILDGERQARQRAYSVEKEKSEIEQRYQAEMSQARDFQLQVTLEKPEVKDAVTAFDQRNGAGAFRSEVIRLGQWTSQNKGIDLTPSQAVEQVLKLYGSAPTPVAPQQGMPAEAQAQAGMTPVTHAKKEPPVIPNVAGGSASPAKTKPKSIADLKKLAQSM